MEQIKNWFHFYNTTEAFEEHKNKGLINPRSICFLRQTGQIYTQNSMIGVDTERFNELESAILSHDAKIKNILGIEGDSVSNDIIDNFKDLTSFLNGYKNTDTLQEVIAGIKEATLNSLSDAFNQIQSDLSESEATIKSSLTNLSARLDNLTSDVDDARNDITTINIQLGMMSSQLNTHINEYKEHIKSFKELKEYAENTWSELDDARTLIESEIAQIDETISQVQGTIEDLTTNIQSSIKSLEDKDASILSSFEEFKIGVKTVIDNFRDTKGVANGIAPLDSNAKVPAEYLPSYVDDVLEYATKSAFPSNGETGKIYISLDDNLTYRWSGTTYVEISKSLALGETSSTAYSGDKGKATTDALASHVADASNPHRVTKAQVGLGNVNNTSDADKPISGAQKEAFDTVTNNIESHKSDTSNPHEVTKAQVGLSNVDNTSDEDKPLSALSRAAITSANEKIDSHIEDYSNPHKVTKNQVGLGNVDNTSDNDKPLSKAQKEAIDTLNDKVDTFMGNTDNPHNVTKEQVGLGNVDNTSDEDKPLSALSRAAVTSTNQKIDSHIEDYSNPHKVTKSQIGLGNVDNTSDADKPISKAQKEALDTLSSRIDSYAGDIIDLSKISKEQLGLGNVDNTSDINKPVSTAQAAAIKVVQDDITSHKNDKTNPHEVTKAQVGLGNVDNTSDANKPISKAVQSALNTTNSTLNSHLGDFSNPHKVTKEQIGLGNVENIADADKPISKATQLALDTLETAHGNHVNDKDNPHEVTKEQVGLGKADNTSDTDKPISKLTKAALDTLETSLNAHIEDKSNPHNVTKSQVGLGSVTNDTQVKRSEMGVASGVATLDESGRVPASQLPSYVDDIIDVYATYTKSTTGVLSDIVLYSDAAKTKPITGESGKIYQNVADGEPSYQFRWTGTVFSQTGASSLIIGDIAGTAYDGAKGKANADNITKIKNTQLSHIKESAPITTTADKVSLNYECYEGTQYGSTGTAYTADIPAATITKAGVMSAADKVEIDKVKDKIDTTDAQAALDRKANIEDLSNVLAEQVIDNPLRTEIETLTREEIKKDLFVDLWNEACGSYGTYNASTGYFELNGLTDITYEEALEIYKTGSIESRYCEVRYESTNIRTNLPPNIGGSQYGFTGFKFKATNIINNSAIQILNVATPTKGFCIEYSSTDSIFNSTVLRKIIGIIDVGNNASPYKNIFITPNLEDVQITYIRNDLDISRCGKLSLDSFKYMVLYSWNSGVTITVHPDIYAKFTDTSNTEWNKVLTDAAAKNITFISA